MHNIGIEFSNKAIIVPNPIKPFEFTRNEQAAKDFRKNLDIPEGEKIILFLGRIHPKKGLDLFLKSVYPILLEEKDWIFVIVGPDEKKHQKKLKKLVECLGIKDKVIFHGAVYDKLKIGAYSAADIFVLTSYNENFGMSVVEAMAFGIPVIISDQVGISREIAEDRAGVVVPLNEKVIHDSLLDLVNNEGLRQQYSISGIECVRKRYNVDTVCSQMIKNYESIINSGK
jgi:glycosyltransferase involved in cell wall biosynthesis